jgi:septum formation protein
MGVVATDALMLFVLASASPARTRLLTDAGVAHVIRVSDIDEQEATNASGWVDAHSVAGGLATAKARDVAASLGAGHLVLGCDSVFDIGGEITESPPTHGRPASAGNGCVVGTASSTPVTM